jgi:hypothetical protein
MAKSVRRKFKQLLAELTGDDAQERAGAAVLLGETGDPAAIEPLVAALEDPEPRVRYHSSFASAICTRMRRWRRWRRRCILIRSGSCAPRRRWRWRRFAAKKPWTR